MNSSRRVDAVQDNIRVPLVRDTNLVAARFVCVLIRVAHCLAELVLVLVLVLALMQGQELVLELALMLVPVLVRGPQEGRLRG